MLQQFYRMDTYALGFAGTHVVWKTVAVVGIAHEDGGFYGGEGVAG
jgi:hypothetical protein